MLKKLQKENKKDLDILERAIASRINQCKMRVDALQNNIDFQTNRIDGFVEREIEYRKELANLESAIQVLRDRTSTDYTSFTKENEEEPKDGN